MPTEETDEFDAERVVMDAPFEVNSSLMGQKQDMSVLPPDIAGAIDKYAAGVEPTGVSQEDAVAAFKKLNSKLGDADQLRVLDAAGRYLTMRLTARILLVNTFNAMQQVEEGLEVAGGLAKDKNNTAEVRLAGVKMLSEAAKAHALLAENAMRFAEVSKEPQTKEPGQNLPPMLGAQTNIQAGTVVIQNGAPQESAKIGESSAPIELNP